MPADLMDGNHEKMLIAVYNIKFCVAVEQILTHWFATMLLGLRYAFRQAKECVVFGEYYVSLYRVFHMHALVHVHLCADIHVLGFH